jgi:hypothetical protein
LVKVADGYHLWSERYDRELEDVFAIQDEIGGLPDYEGDGCVHHGDTEDAATLQLVDQPLETGHTASAGCAAMVGSTA